MSLPAPTPLVFCSNPFDGDLPFQAWSDLSLEIDGQPEHNENLLNLAGFLVRQALVDQQPERLKQASDVESALYGLRAHVQLHSGGCFDFGDEHSDAEVKEHQVTPGLAIGKLLLVANEPGCVGIEELHERLKPVDATTNALAKLQASDMPPINLICALLPGMTITLTPPFADSRTLVYPSRLDTYQQQLKLEELAGLPQQRCEILLGDQLLNEAQPAYGIAYDILSMMLRLLRQRALENDQPDLSARQQQWQRVRLVIGSGLHYSAQFMLNPETYQPAFGNAVRGLKLAGTQSILLPDHLDLPALEQIWEALAHEDMLVEWQRVQTSKDVADRSLMLNLEVACTLEVLAIGAEQQLQVLESYRDSEFMAEPAEQQAEEVAATPLPEAEQTPAPALEAGAAGVEQPAASPRNDQATPHKSGSYGPLLLAAVIVAMLTAILLRG
ncbi:hypothetical protein [Pseudomonas sp. 8O]|uniref:hypothetical protein n=1 Tax=Pseudomonas sp. 8O TaxID=2653165 RepID=UPI0012F0753B|nr:hypothetical protein [Pseudomonas sp. 8O]VXB48521.1 conserved hypothetical protein [Pseudomonas sp. 8O]